MVNLHKLRAISSAIHSVTEYQSSRVLYFFREVRSVMRVAESIPVLDEDEQHRVSLSLEPRDSVASLPHPLEKLEKSK
jgi:hypothetical protein